MTHDRQTISVMLPSFWPEPREPEAWLRTLAYLDELSGGETPPTISGPRGVWDQLLSRRISRRSVPGLFGLEHSGRLRGIGLLEPTTAESWVISDAGRALLTPWHEGKLTMALEALAIRTLEASVWLRLLLLRIAGGHWQLAGWEGLRADNGVLLPVRHLLMPEYSTPEAWFVDIEMTALGVWREAHLADITLKPAGLGRASEAFPWSALKAPLYLLDSLGWLHSTGLLRLPERLADRPYCRALAPRLHTPAALLRQITRELADFNGYCALEPAMRRLAEGTGLAADDAPAFHRWSDLLLETAVRQGAIELLDAQPGQARHGRGLFGDLQRKLVRWQIHDEFNTIFRTFAPEEGV